LVADQKVVVVQIDLEEVVDHMDQVVVHKVLVVGQIVLEVVVGQEDHIVLEVVVDQEVHIVLAVVADQVDHIVLVVVAVQEVHIALEVLVD